VADRITDTDLNTIAEELFETTGERFFVNFPGGVPTLFCKQKKGVVTCFAGKDKRDLYNQLIRFQAGIALGFQVCSDGKHPDLKKDPKAALTRMSKEVGVLLQEADPANTAAGYIDKLENVSAEINRAIDYAGPLDDDDN